MSRQLDVDQVVRGWLAEGAERAPEHHVLFALGKIEAISQRRPGPIANGASRVWSTITQSPYSWGTALAAAVVIATALIFGSALVGDVQPPTPTAPSDRTSPPPSAPAPPDASVQRSETSIGTIEWTRIVAPQAIHPQEGPSGSVLGSDFEGGSSWMLSDDLVWEPAPPPELIAGATYLGPGDEWATVSPDGYGVMMGPVSSRQVISRDYTEGGDATIFRREGSEWIELSIPSTAPALPAGLQAFGPRFQGAAALDSTSLVVPVLYHVEVPWGEVFGKYPEPASGVGLVDPWPVWDESGQQLRIVEPGSNPFAGPALAVLEVDFAADDRSVIEFRDAETGELVHSVVGEMPGWSPDALLAGLRGWGFEAASLVVYRDREITVVQAPWPMEEEWSDASPIVTGLGRYYTTSLPLGDGYAATSIHLWESSDGVEWTLVDLPAAATDDVDWVEIGGRADGLVMSVHGQSEADSLWTSADGRAWAEADVVGASLAMPVATDFGWLLAGASAISADGETWETLEVPLLPGEPALQYLGGLFLYGPGIEGGEHVTWIGRLVP